jgi:hypothetical protein
MRRYCGLGHDSARVAYAMVYCEGNRDFEIYGTLKALVLFGGHPNNPDRAGWKSLLNDCALWFQLLTSSPSRKN